MNTSSSSKDVARLTGIVSFDKTLWCSGTNRRLKHRIFLPSGLPCLLVNVLSGTSFVVLRGF